VNQVANALEDKEYIFSSADKQDSRKRIVSLSAKGELLVQELRPLWEAVENAVVRLLEQSSPSFLKEFEVLEKQLEIRSMEQRIELELKNLYSKKLKLIPFKPSLKSYFKVLNAAWLQKEFMVEKEDERLLDDPEGTVIQKGGAIIFAAVDDKVIGTGALLPREDGSAEITKMTVKEGYRGYGFGRRILQYLIKEAEIRGYKTIVLFTSEQLTPAVSLYRSAGFARVPEQSGRKSNYSRLSIQMRKSIM
jgi:ribosomal protein S18 acetylase RimI-like enzyme